MEAHERDVPPRGLPPAPAAQAPLHHRLRSRLHPRADPDRARQRPHLRRAARAADGRAAAPSAAGDRDHAHTWTICRPSGDRSAPRSSPTSRGARPSCGPASSRSCRKRRSHASGAGPAPESSGGLPAQSVTEASPPLRQPSRRPLTPRSRQSSRPSDAALSIPSSASHGCPLGRPGAGRAERARGSAPIMPAGPAWLLSIT